MHWVTKIIYHSCYFTSLSNCLLFKQKGYLNCYVAQLFMPWHKNACLLLHGKVTHYNPTYSPPPHPHPRCCRPLKVFVGYFTPGEGGKVFREDSRGFQLSPPLWCHQPSFSPLVPLWSAPPSLTALRQLERDNYNAWFVICSGLSVPTLRLRYRSVH